MPTRNKTTETLWAVTAAVCLMGCGEDPSPSGSPGAKLLNQKTAALGVDEHASPGSSPAVVIDAPPGAKAGNALCVVGDEPVDAQGRMVVYKDKVYGFCCDECVDRFKADPDKYAQK